MMEVTLEKDVFMTHFSLLEKGNGRGPAWLREIRRAAIARFAEIGFPTTSNEEWRFTSVAPIARTAFRPAEPRRDVFTAERLDRLTFGGENVHRVVFLNGRLSRELSSAAPLPSGVRLSSLAATLDSAPDDVRPYLARHVAYENHAFAALNTALMEDGAFLHVAQGVVVDKPIHLVYVSWRATPACRESISRTPSPRSWRTKTPSSTTTSCSARASTPSTWRRSR
jgi:Fe-S cluster assembly protein SufD